MGVNENVPMMSIPGMGRIPIKYVALLTLIVQNCGVVLLMRYSRTLDGDKAVPATIVVCQEFLKLCLSLCLVYYEAGSVNGLQDTIRRELFGKPVEALKLSVPTILYTIQNNCILIGLSNLQAAVFHVLYQSKLIVAAMLSVTMLGRTLQPMQWAAVLMLTLGVALVQVATSSKKAADTEMIQYPSFGLAAVITAALCSGFAGVYFEKILKGSSTSVWVRNIQLATGGTLIGLLIVIMQDGAEGVFVWQQGFFFGYNWTVWGVILSNAGGGLLIAIVIKYADNILKGFACSFAIVCSSLLSVFLFNFEVSFLFFLGTAVVCMSVYLYTPRPQPSSSSPTSSSPIGSDGKDQQEVAAPLLPTSKA